MIATLYEIFVGSVSVYKSYDWRLTQFYLLVNYNNWLYSQEKQAYVKIQVY